MYVFLILSISLNLSFLANILPNILYTMANGENLEVANRGINESEVYALKIIHLILPQYISRLGFLKSLTGRYLNSSMPLQNENTSSSLGIVLSIGFVTLLVNILLNNSSAQSKFLHPGFVRIFRYISSLNLYILLFSTVGGLGSIFALTISPQIRAWNRISVFIAFLAVMATSILLESAYYRFVKSGFHKICFYTLCVLIFYVGILDQTSLQFIPSYTDFENGFYNDQKFISTIESSLKPYSMVFQLPYVPYPEAGSLAKIGDYDHMRGYLHSKYLRWSYGSVRGREPSNWQKSISSEPIDEVLVKKLSVVGFDGIYIDRYGYEDNGRQIQSDFIEILKDYPLEDDQKRFMFFNIQDFKEKYIETLKVDREMCKDIALAKPMITFDTGFYAIETDGKDNWRWSNQTGQIKLTNSTKQERSVTMGMEVASGSSTPSSLKVYTDDGDYESNITTISGTPTEYSITLTLKPMHETIINFESNAQQVESLDTRIMFFRLLNFTFTFSDPKEQKCW
ncbi:hypothetical protein PROH_14500 [Prochlorothrix hollandica PCC 9006 = CALU 1027]|uniref:Uncharacterized protein n=2 Tax=Prochlorothrix hollandica TaxID=1223 RepID=A0A0M2PXB3_PROHO|nr:hypothetical protein PROH_14500 [Prochlorothrix hollandica PCC 9006 = CALU 1027]